VLRAAHEVATNGIATPILLGHADTIRAQIQQLGLDFNPEIVDPATSEKRAAYAEAFYAKRQRKGVTLARANDLLRQSTYFGLMMVEQGEADAFVAGLSYNYVEVLRPALQCIGAREGGWVSGVYVMLVQEKIYFFTDVTVTIDPSAEQLAAIALNAAELAKLFDVDPRIAMISFSNFGSTPDVRQERVRQAAELVKAQRPDLPVDGEMQADVAVTPELMARHYPFSQVSDANVLVFPGLASANSSYKLLNRLGGAEAIGPILVGMNKPVHVLATGADVRDIINVSIMAVVDAQAR
jgi:malate dehydrogenase (oxaloacetate-decarboxylating)(NADP+)